MRKIFFVLLVFSYFSLASAAAREIEITVQDTDLEIPLEGAIIRSWDGSEYECDEDGRATLVVPDDRQVVLQFVYPGYENGRLVIPLAGNSFSFGMRLGGVLENRELVIEARRPETSETKVGRSVAISGEALSRTAEIGFVEDVMSSIKLLPGVGYTGMFSAQPSIRGGDPGDLMASLDGFYVENPYHWGGTYSIFVPQMVESARLSHGVFSGRYGHSISGILDIASKNPDTTEMGFGVGVGSSQTDFNVSYPLFGKGGIMAMGKVTYWDPFVWGAQALSKAVPEIDAINSIKKAPFIRDFSITGNYRFTDSLDFRATGFLGSDGVGAEYHNEFNNSRGHRKVDLLLDWVNTNAFLVTGLTYNPRYDMVLRGTAGIGLYQSDLIADIGLHLADDDVSLLIPDEGGSFMPQSMQIEETLTQTNINYQGRIDFDWDLGNGFLLAGGVQELYSRWLTSETSHSEVEYAEGQSSNALFDIPDYKLDTENQGLSSTFYTLGEWTSSDGKFGAELGFRLDHFHFIGRDFTIPTYPVVNPRLNLDYKLLQNIGIIDTLTLTVGTGLFSSINDAITNIDVSNNITDYELKPNRSWTSIVGGKLDLYGGYSFNLEVYYKSVFDRAYVRTDVYGKVGGSSGYSVDNYYFDGTGQIFGFDLMLQKMYSRYLDGWLSYSFNYARYRDPHAVPETIPVGQTEEDYPATGNGWYFPSFHRFNYLNLVLNIKPTQAFNIGLRFGLATGTPDSSDNNKRIGFSWPVDVKFSFYKFNPKGKVRREIYIAAENLQALVYDAQLLSQGENYTGDEDASEYRPVYDMPIPMISFGFKWSY
ncbi:hypothetical protein FACS189485_15900 [Spirochaetia bacterium]|nr:hypothetical protein FACS189485_15900 [Spirochaetia bacterium]